MTSFVVALHAEAKPLIEHYGLEPTNRHGFRVFEGAGRRLVVSGVGKVAAAAATAYLQDTPLDVWVNVGIGGHRDRAPGEMVRATRVSDASTAARYYPTSVGLTEFDTAGVTTVDVPETVFASSDVFDMEAAGFYPTALRFSTSELVHCVKIVSDNVDTGTDQLTSPRVTELIENNLGAVVALVDELEALASTIEPLRVEPDADSFLRSWHFTASQKRRLTRILMRHRAFEQQPSADDFRGSPTSQVVLDRLSESLQTLASQRQSF